MLTFDRYEQPPAQKDSGGRSHRHKPGLVRRENVVAALRWSNPESNSTAEASDKHQLLYLMEGQGSIRLDDKDYDVSKGAGVYLVKSATIRPVTSASLKVLHLVASQIPG